MVVVALSFWGVQLRVIQVATERSKYSNYTANPSKYGKVIHFHYHRKARLTITLVENRSIIKSRDPMQNPDQTRIFYIPGQTRTKRDPVDRITRMTQPGSNPD